MAEYLRAGVMRFTTPIYVHGIKGNLKLRLYVARKPQFDIFGLD
jgi:hypothetical protein